MDGLRPSAGELVAAYRRGWFPMDDPAAAARPVAYYDADPRAIIPLDAVRIPRSVRRAVRRHRHEIRIDGAFAEVVVRCAERPADSGVWLTDRLIAAYVALHRAGRAHSVECWSDGVLVGGLFGVALGALFTSESMFHAAPDAGNLALAATAERLRERDFRLWDIQMLSEHTARFGAIEIVRADYRRRLTSALALRRTFA